jgi:hypothetical protein
MNIYGGDGVLDTGTMPIDLRAQGSEPIRLPQGFAARG